MTTYRLAELSWPARLERIALMWQLSQGINVAPSAQLLIPRNRPTRFWRRWWPALPRALFELVDERKFYFVSVIKRNKSKNLDLRSALRIIGPQDMDGIGRGCNVAFVALHAYKLHSRPSPPIWVATLLQNTTTLLLINKARVHSLGKSANY
jgi:hypothetical protein